LPFARFFFFFADRILQVLHFCFVRNNQTQLCCPAERGQRKQELAMFRFLKNLTGSSSARRTSSRSNHRFRPSLESLDGRILPSTTGLLSSVTDNTGAKAFVVGGDWHLYLNDGRWHDLGVPTIEPGNPNFVQGQWIGNISASLDANGNADCFVTDQLGYLWLWSRSGWKQCESQYELSPTEGWPGRHSINLFSATEQNEVFAVFRGSNQVMYYNANLNTWHSFGSPPDQGTIDQISSTAGSAVFVHTSYSLPVTYRGITFQMNASDVYNVMGAWGTGIWTNTNAPWGLTQISASPRGATNGNMFALWPNWNNDDVFGLDGAGNVWVHSASTNQWSSFLQNYGIKQIGAGFESLVAIDNNGYVLNYNFTGGGMSYVGSANFVSANTGDHGFFTLNATQHSNGLWYNEISDYPENTYWYNGSPYEWFSWGGYDTGGWSHW
jgi:hypothetical protein